MPLDFGPGPTGIFENNRLIILGDVDHDNNGPVLERSVSMAAAHGLRHLGLEIHNDLQPVVDEHARGSLSDERFTTQFADAARTLVKQNSESPLGIAQRQYREDVNAAKSPVVRLVEKVRSSLWNPAERREEAIYQRLSNTVIAAHRAGLTVHCVDDTSDLRALGETALPRSVPLHDRKRELAAIQEMSDNTRITKQGNKGIFAIADGVLSANEKIALVIGADHLPALMTLSKEAAIKADAINMYATAGQFGKASLRALGGEFSHAQNGYAVYVVSDNSFIPSRNAQDMSPPRPAPKR